MARKKEGPKQWSYNAGEKGRNWVRVFEKRPGKYMLEWREAATDPETGAPILDPRTDRPVMLRPRAMAEASNRGEAKAAADAAAAGLAKLALQEAEASETSPSPRTMSLKRLLTLYETEVVENKRPSVKGMDLRSRRVWMAFFDAQEEAERRTTREASTLDRTDWDRFIEWRRSGRVPGWAAVERRQVQADLQYLVKVLNWATGVRLQGSTILNRNPWGTEIRRAQKWPMPRNPKPRRPSMTQEIRSALIMHSSSWQFAAALELEHETRRRNGSIRQLYWDEINLEEATVIWRAEADKARRDGKTPLTPRAVEILRSLPSRGIGHVPVFPSGKDRKTPASRHSFQRWLRRAKAGLLKSVPAEQREAMQERLRGLGFHGEKRGGVRDPHFRSLSPKVQEEFAGTRYETLRTIYDEVGVEEMRSEIAAMQREVRGAIDTAHLTPELVSQ